MITKMEKFLFFMFLVTAAMLVVVLRAWDRDKQTLAEVTHNYTEVAAECRVLREENKQLRQILSDKN